MAHGLAPDPDLRGSAFVAYIREKLPHTAAGLISKHAQLTQTRLRRKEWLTELGRVHPQTLPFLPTIMRAARDAKFASIPCDDALRAALADLCRLASATPHVLGVVPSRLGTACWLRYAWLTVGVLFDSEGRPAVLLEPEKQPFENTAALPSPKESFLALFAEDAKRWAMISRA